MAGSPRPASPTGIATGAEDITQAVLDTLAAHVAIIDASGEIVQVNRAWTEFARANSPTIDGLCVGANYLAACDTARGDRTAAHVAGSLRDLIAGRPGELSLEYPCHAPDVQRWFRVRAVRVGSITDEDGGVVRVVVTHENITDRHRAVEDLHLRAKVLRDVDAPVVVTAPDGTIVEWNPAAQRLFGWTSEEVRGQRWGALSRADPVIGKMLRTLRATGRLSGERDLRCADGTVVRAHLHGVRVDDDAGQPLALLVLAVDLTAHVEAERRLRGARAFLEAVALNMGEGMFTHDPGGRLTFVNEAAAQMLGCGPGDPVGWVMGHAGHDASPVRVVDAEFQRSDGSRLEVEYTSSPFVTEDGVAGRVVVFSDISERKAQERRLLARVGLADIVGSVREALDEGRMVLHAQPIIDVRTRATVQHELLIRMVRTDGEVISPGAFLPAAEEFGLIREVDRWVVKQAIRLAATGAPVELNLSAASIGDRDLVSDITTEMRRRGADPALVVFELTETGILRDRDAAQATIQGLTDLGSSVALDDFGTGYSGFVYLKHLPFRYLKIDIDFIRDLTTSEASRHVVEAVVDLAQRFGLQTVAEGVEDLATLALLQDFGVDLAQGMAIGSPVSLADAFGGDRPSSMS